MPDVDHAPGRLLHPLSRETNRGNALNVTAGEQRTTMRVHAFRHTGTMIFYYRGSTVGHEGGGRPHRHRKSGPGRLARAILSFRDSVFLNNNDSQKTAALRAQDGLQLILCTEKHLNFGMRLVIS